MQSFSIMDLKDVDLNTVNRDELVDIRDVRNPYCYRHGKYVVKVGFSDTEVSLEERLAGYIRSKC